MATYAECLRQIHRIHRQLADLNDRLSRGPRQIKATQDRIALLGRKVEASKEAHKRTRLTIHEKELSLKEREGRILDIRGRLNSCSSNKEYQAYIEQIAADDQANSVLSDEIIDLWDKASSDEAAVRAAEAELQQYTTELEKVQKKVAGERGVLVEEVERLQMELRDAENNLPVEIRADYQRVVSAHGDEALAPVDSECCGGCYQKITAQMINELRMDRIIFCKSCGRILYQPEDTSVVSDDNN